MHTREDADHIAILDRTVDMVKNALPDNTFKIMVDKNTLKQLLDRDPPGFFWAGTENGGNRYRDIPLLYSDLISGVWIHLH